MTDPIDTLFTRADRFGIPMSAICKEAGVAQSTPSRWKADKAAANFGSVRKLTEALDKLIEEKHGDHDVANIALSTAPSSDKSAESISGEEPGSADAAQDTAHSLSQAGAGGAAGVGGAATTPAPVDTSDESRAA